MTVAQLILALLLSVSLYHNGSCQNGDHDGENTREPGVMVLLTDVPDYHLLKIPFAVTTVVRSDTVWRRLNEQFVTSKEYDPETGVTQPVSLGAVDFDSSMVLIVSIGAVGCALTEPAKLISGARVNGDTLVVSLGGTSEPKTSDEDSICLPAIDYPVHAVTLPVHHGPVLFTGQNGAVQPSRSLFQSHDGHD